MSWPILIAFALGYGAGMVIALALALRRSNRYRDVHSLGDAGRWRARHDEAHSS